MDAALDASSVVWRLIDNKHWRRYDAAVDPLPSHEPAQIVCGVGATYIEYGNFEVDTTRCNYVLSEHPSQKPIDKGTSVHVSMLYYDLLAAEPAEAHIAIFFRDAMQWETHLAIPQPGNSIEADFTSTVDLGFDEPIRLHLHNHGANSYMVTALEAHP